MAIFKTIAETTQEILEIELFVINYTQCKLQITKP